MSEPNTRWEFDTDTDPNGAREPMLRWLMLEGNRLYVTGGIIVAVVAVTGSLTAVGVISVGRSSNVRTLLSSGVTSGLLTLITVALSINQLILSRVFGTPDALRDRLDTSLDFREHVEDITGRTSSPMDPTDFLALIMGTIHERAGELDLSDAALDEAEGYRSSLVEYSGNVTEEIEGHESMVGVLSEVVGDEYAQYLTATKHVQNAHGDDLSEESQSALSDVFELLKAVAIARQHFKTLSIQQDLARLSRFIAYTGLLALVTTFCLTLLYKSSSGAYVPLRYLPFVLNAGFGVIVAPLAVLIAYILRVATIARYTVSVGPFVPPEERGGEL